MKNYSYRSFLSQLIQSGSCRSAAETVWRRACACLCLLAGVIAAGTPATGYTQGTAFTYQGRLVGNGLPASGVYDFTFGLYNASSGGSQVGNTVTNSSLMITGGVLVAVLDFGNVFDGTRYYLQVGVRTNGVGAFTALNPRRS